MDYYIIYKINDICYNQISKWRFRGFSRSSNFAQTCSICILVDRK